MAKFDNAVVILNKENFNGYKGNPPTNETEYNSVKDEMFSANPPTWQEIQSEITKQDNAETTKKTDRTNAINKLNGATYSALTDAEAKALFGE